MIHIFWEKENLTQKVNFIFSIIYLLLITQFFYNHISYSYLLKSLYPFSSVFALFAKKIKVQQSIEVINKSAFF